MSDEKEFLDKMRIKNTIRDLQYDERFPWKVRKLANELYKVILEEG